MIKTYLTSLLVFAALISNAQVELGLSAGTAFNTVPKDNLPVKGGNPVIQYAVTASALYNMGFYWQAGISIHTMPLSVRSAQPLPTGGNSRIVYAAHAPAICLVANRKILIRNGYAYGGVAAGYGFTAAGSGDQAYHLSYNGNGPAAGVQIGYVKGLNARLAFSIEAACRYYFLTYNVPAPQAALKFDIAAFPVTIGLRYRLHDRSSREKARQDAMNVGGF